MGLHGGSSNSSSGGSGGGIVYIWYVCIAWPVEPSDSRNFIDGLYAEYVSALQNAKASDGGMDHPLHHAGPLLVETLPAAALIR